MPISVRQDVAPEFGLGQDRIGLRATEGYSGGSYLDHVRERIADRNYRRFHESWGLDPGFVNPFEVEEDLQRSVTKALAAHYGLAKNPETNRAIFDDLWPVLWAARRYNQEEDTKLAIDEDLDQAYRFAGLVASGGAVPDAPTTWARIADEGDHSLYVVFSDHHMTAFDDFTLENYFLDYNYDLYLAVLRHYKSQPDVCLVENGDVEECVIYETTAADARARRTAAPRDLLGNVKPHMPIRQRSVDWKPFLELRYEKRRQSLASVISHFHEYYDLVRQYIREGRYVRLTGNHDTYSETQREDTLLEMIDAELNRGLGSGARFALHDVLRIHKGSEVTHVIMHGHQFDTVSIQHGSVPYALSLGEVFSEVASWIYQGPDRFWTSADSRKWINGEAFPNRLAREEFLQYRDDQDDGLLEGVIEHVDLVTGGGATEPVLDLLLQGSGGLDRIKAQPRAFVETLLKHEIAWEYFENKDAYHALTLEVATGDEFFKFRHLNERTLSDRYAEAFRSRGGTSPIPKLLIGHTHEVRQNALNPDTGEHADHYLNSGSAGRFENLIWCVEIDESGDRIVSWSGEGGLLKKISWRSVDGTLRHDHVETFSAP